MKYKTNKLLILEASFKDFSKNSAGIIKDGSNAVINQAGKIVNNSMHFGGRRIGTELKNASDALGISKLANDAKLNISSNFNKGYDENADIRKTRRGAGLDIHDNRIMTHVRDNAAKGISAITGIGTIGTGAILINDAVNNIDYN